MTCVMRDEFEEAAPALVVCSVIASADDRFADEANADDEGALMVEVQSEVVYPNDCAFLDQYIDFVD